MKYLVGETIKLLLNFDYTACINKPYHAEIICKMYA